MNLIEHLGGYSMAYAYCKSLSDGATACMYMNTIYSKESLELELHQYRRKHNIFEVGDKVVSGKDVEKSIHKIELVDNENKSLKIFSSDMKFSYWVDSREFKHATDEEIAAGRRL